MNSKPTRKYYTMNPNRPSESDLNDSNLNNTEKSLSINRSVNFNRKKVKKPSRNPHPKEDFLSGKNQLPAMRKISSKKNDFQLPDENSLHLFEPNLMDDEDFNDIKKNNDNKKIRPKSNFNKNQMSNSKGRREKFNHKKIKKSNSMLGTNSNTQRSHLESSERLNKSFQMNQVSSKNNMKPYSSNMRNASHGLRNDKHSEMSFKIKKSKRELPPALNAKNQSQFNSKKSNQNSTKKPNMGGGTNNPGRERNFTLGPMGFSNKVFQNFNAENQSKAGTNDYNSQKTFLTESNNTNVFVAKSIQNKSVLTDVSNMEIKEDVRERQETEGQKSQNEYGYKELRAQTSIENDIQGGRQSEQEGDSLDNKIKKNIRNSIKEDSMFGEAFNEYNDMPSNPFEMKPNKVFSISNNDPQLGKDSAFKKSKTEKFEKQLDSARISFEMTSEQLKKKREELKKNPKYEIEADKTLGNKSPSNRSISFENKAKNRFYVEKQKELKKKKIKKSNSIMMNKTDTTENMKEQHLLNKSLGDFSEPEFKNPKESEKAKNVFMSSVENNIFAKFSPDLRKKTLAVDQNGPKSDQKKNPLSMNPILANKSLHSNFKFSSTNQRTKKINMFGAKPKGNMAYSSAQNSMLQSIPSLSQNNPGSPSINSNKKLFNNFDIEEFEDKNDSIDLMDEEDEDFDLNFDMNQSINKVKSKVLNSSNKMTPNNFMNSASQKMSNNPNIKNSLQKQLDLKQRVNSPMMLQKEVIDNSANTMRSNTSHSSGKKNFIHTFGKKPFEFENGKQSEAKAKAKARESIQIRPKQFTFNNKMVLTSFKNKGNK
jgi:hypothetical protein